MPGAALNSASTCCVKWCDTHHVAQQTDLDLSRPQTFCTSKNMFYSVFVRECVRAPDDATWQRNQHNQHHLTQQKRSVFGNKAHRIAQHPVFVCHLLRKKILSLKLVGLLHALFVRSHSEFLKDDLGVNQT